MKKINKTNTLEDFGVKQRLEFVNNKLRGKTIKRLFSAERKRVIVEFTDESQGMIEVLCEGGDGEPFLSIMPPTKMSEEFRISQANVSAHPIELPQQATDSPSGEQVTENGSSPERRDLGAASCSASCSAYFGTEDDPFGVGCKPEEFEDSSFLHGGIYRVSSESDLQGVLELLRMTLESDSDSIVVHLSVYRARNSRNRDLSGIGNHPQNHTQEPPNNKNDD